MKAIILAAGLGTRMGPLAASRPKCLVELMGASLLDHQLAVYEHFGVDVTVMAGAHPEQIQAGRDVRVVVNPAYTTGNMVATLRFSLPVVSRSEPVLVAYGDIVFSREVLGTMLAASRDIDVAIDTQWRRLWELRMEDPTTDCESLRLDGERIVEIGARVRSVEEVQGQYIGLLRFGPGVLHALYERFDLRVAKDPRYWNTSMTGFLQDLIAEGVAVHAVPIASGWLEADNAEDLRRYTEAHASGALAGLWSPTAVSR
ncbi:phosphocholine cytidylyltransferase family protein [Corallococcus sp. BB11-1]|uniref:phosphocholine cytidylyltransferase family protein n=1 Tax=Corallococcus sp. BB11-1 TaxID=2996783 RepID=UPI002270E690|nr:phosphocholine cytidylyltransferase family protein [Corallococcus sp. BB11-1]MCY1033027.1 phosphocholine cytidylyltransferase family protein [Corallococcus sp. BB11-1]